MDCRQNRTGAEHMTTNSTVAENIQQSVDNLRIVADDLRVAASELRVSSLEQKQAASELRVSTLEQKQAASDLRYWQGMEPRTSDVPADFRAGTGHCLNIPDPLWTQGQDECPVSDDVDAVVWQTSRSEWKWTGRPPADRVLPDALPVRDGLVSPDITWTSSRAAVQHCRQAGFRPVVTGSDQQATKFLIALSRAVFPDQDTDQSRSAIVFPDPDQAGLWIWFGQGLVSTSWPSADQACQNAVRHRHRPVVITGRHSDIRLAIQALMDGTLSDTLFLAGLKPDGTEQSSPEPGCL